MATTTITFVPTLVQDSSGVTRYRVQASITAKGDLPNIEIFLYQIVDATDPKLDVLIRTGSVADITTYDRDRVVAVAHGATYYLSSTITITQDDVATATATKELIKARVDALVLSWTDYQTNFLADNVASIPLVSASVVTAAKGMYSSARDGRDAATDLVTAASENYADADAAAVDASGDVVATTARKAVCDDVVGTLGTAKTKLDAYVTNGAALRAAAAAFLANHIVVGPDHVVPTAGPNGFTTFNAYVNGTFPAQQTEGDEGKALLGTAATDLGALDTSLGTEKNTAATDKATADQAKAAAQTALIAAQAALVQAQAAFDAALGRVMALCPTFDPSA